MKKIIIIAVCLLNSIVGLTQPLIPVTIISTVPELICPGDSIDVNYIVTQNPMPSYPFSIGVFLNHNSNVIFDTIFEGNTSDLVCIDTLAIGFVYKSRLYVPYGTPTGQWCASGNFNLNMDFCVIVKNTCASPCDSIPTPLSYSTGSYTFCTPGTTNIGYNNALWVRITPSYCDTSSCVWTVNNGSPTQTSSIIFTPASAGITSFTLNAVQHFHGAHCFQSVSFTFTTIVCSDIGTTTGIKEYEQYNYAPVYYDIYGRQTELKPKQLLAEYRNDVFVRKVVFDN